MCKIYRILWNVNLVLKLIFGGITGTGCIKLKTSSRVFGEVIGLIGNVSVGGYENLVEWRVKFVYSSSEDYILNSDK